MSWAARQNSVAGLPRFGAAAVHRPSISQKTLHGLLQDVAGRSVFSGRHRFDFGDEGRG